MAYVLCYYRNHYFIWDTNQDAPGTYGMTEAECIEWFHNTYRLLGFGQVAEYLVRATKLGTSSEVLTLKDINDFNRAGIWEGYLTLDEIYQIYCVEKRSPTEEDAQD